MENKNKISTQKKLCLRRRNNDSSNIKTEVKEIESDSLTIKQQNLNTQKLSCFENDNIDDNGLSKTDDSIKEFKSPIKNPISKISKFKIQVDKPKKKISVKNKSKKNSATINQPSIESSFFTSTNNQNEGVTSIPCPVCLKPFKDDRSCTIHMKSCAAKNKVSIKQLLDAKELQNRQAEERKAMGLLAAPVIPERKKGLRPKKDSLENDPQLQLALAMSESLQEAEQMEFEEAALLAGIPEPCIKEITSEERRKTLTSFGFTSNKPASETTTNKFKRKKLQGPTILQTRSQEDKERVLTERIACILTGDDALTQSQNKNATIKPKITKYLNSQNLKQMEKKKNNLWEHTRLTKTKIDFYVKNLRNHFLLNDDKGFEKSLMGNDNNSQDINEDLNATIRSETYEPIEINTDEIQESELNSSNISLAKETEENFEYNFFNKLISNWRDALDDSAASDLVIYLKNNEIIYTHKLICHVQCPNTLLDIETANSYDQSKIAEKILWPQIDKISALGFLEFLYCGSISKYVNVFNDESYLSQVRELARLYQVKDLFSYLRKKQNNLFLNKMDTMSTDSMSNALSKNNEEQVLGKSHSFPIEANKNLTSFKKCNSDTALVTSILSKQNKNSILSDRRFTMSPELFDSEEEYDGQILMTNTQNISNTNNCEVSENNTQLEILVNLIEEDSKENENKKNSQNLSIELETNSTKISPLRSISFTKHSEFLGTNSNIKSNSIEPSSSSNLTCNSIETEIKGNKPKSNMSLFIEKFQRQNKRDILESDSDIDSPSPVKYKPRNPFLKNLYNNSSDPYSAKDPILKYGCSLLNDIFKKDEKKEMNNRNFDVETKSVNNISLPESTIENIDNDHLNKLDDNENKSQDKNVSCYLDSESESLQNDTCNETDISMYSKYKKKNKNNSIDKYRKLLILNPEDLDEKSIPNLCDEKSRQLQNDADVTLVSDSDDELNYINKNTQNRLQNDTPIEKTSPVIELVDSSDESNFPPNLDLTQNNCRKESSSDFINSSTKGLSQEVNNSILCGKENAEEDIEDEDEISKMLRLSQEFSEEVSELLDGCKRFSQSPVKQSANNSIPINLSPISICSSPDLDKNNSKEISKIHDSENNFEPDNAYSDNEIEYECKKSLTQSPLTKSINNTIPINLSPISICSSPELNKNNSQGTSEANKFKSKDSHFDDKIVDEVFNEIEFADDWVTDSPIFSSNKFNNSQKINSLKNSSLINESSKNENKDKKTCNKLELSSLIFSPIINTTSNLKTNCPNSKSSKELDFLNSPEISSLSKRKMNCKSISDKKFGNAKKDESNFLLQRSTSFTTPPRLKQTVSQKFRTNFEDVTPPLDYSTLETPALRKELKKYGLKPLSRDKAKLMLRHIYNETHPLVPLTQKRVSSSDEDEEPPLKRQNTSTKSEESLTLKHCKSKSKLEFDKSSGIAEEMDFDEPELLTNSKNKANIKDAFNSLIKSDKILYNKILTYEPLPLEELHLTLKTQGLKCNVKDLMNYLDEQCITFKVTTATSSRKKKS